MVLQGELLTAYESEAVTPTISSWSFSRCHLVLIFHILMVFMMVIVTAFRMSTGDEQRPGACGAAGPHSGARTQGTVPAGA